MDVIEILRKQYTEDLRTAKEQLAQAEKQVEDLATSIDRLTGALIALNQVEQGQQKATAATPTQPIAES